MKSGECRQSIVVNGILPRGWYNSGEANNGAGVCRSRRGDSAISVECRKNPRGLTTLDISGTMRCRAYFNRPVRAKCGVRTKARGVQKEFGVSKLCVCSAEFVHDLKKTIFNSYSFEMTTEVIGEEIHKRPRMC